MERGRAAYAGIGIALVGYTSSFAIVLAGLQHVGATRAEATSGLVMLCVALGLGTLWLSSRRRMPISLAWSTPGAAVLASAAAPLGGWPVAIGAFLATAALIALAGSVPVFGRLVARVPAPIAQAMLAGVLLDICTGPIKELSRHPWPISLILVTWLVLSRFAPRWAVPGSFVTLLVVAVHGAAPVGVHDAMPHLIWIAPEFTPAGLLGITVPLFIATMAAQNLPGVAIMSSYGYQVPWRESMITTALGTAAAAPFGGHAINLAAISAAVPASAEAHPDPAKRWPASAAFGIAYLFLGLVTTGLVAYLAATPPAVVGAVAAVGLLPTLGGALSSVVSQEGQRIPAVTTFVVAASNLSLLGIGSVFWALVAGILSTAVLRSEPRWLRRVAGG